MAKAPQDDRNTGLETLLEQAQWSRTQLANAVNRTGVQVGMTLKYDHSAVSHWLSGTQPREQVRPVIIEVLERKIGRPVTYAEVGLQPPKGGEDSGSGDTVESLLDLGRADMDPSRRGVLAAGLYSAALVVPLFASEAHAEERERATKPTGRIGPGEVATVRTMTDRIADILDELGGGHARPMAAAFLVNTVAPYLRAQATEPVRNDMLSAASDLTYLTGWMAMYEREHGLGQHYYVKALNLAKAAADHVTYCRTLRGMSLQASHLRHGQMALKLADSAAEAAPKAGPRLVAFLRGQQAYSAAMVGDRKQAFTRLREAEAALSKADSRRDAVGGYDQAAYQFHVAHVLYETKDLAGSIAALKSSVRAQPKQERQGRLHANGVMAQRQYELGHIEEACSTWNTFLDDYVGLSTARGDEHFETMRKRLAPHRKVRAVRELGERARQVATLKG
ncbi:tol-pal system YbgF family protein [Streptomyces sp. NPDC088146]|uniref:tetratricopeptide repeat protein n=1 Tax=Streptomyces sp. NPDC088146 TaxID=3365829 RepID=UPI0038050559